MLISEENEVLFHKIIEISSSEEISSEEDVQKIYEFQKTIAHKLETDRYIYYNPEKIREITKALVENKSNGKGILAVTMTTCKRIDLFEKTINSFIYCCADLKNFIGDWIVVDDNSSEEDRKIMISRYPFIRFILKSPDEKGHAKSMNIIREELLPKMDTLRYFFHLEDDWKFLIPLNYITRCLIVLSQNINYGQCLLNRGYGEDFSTGLNSGSGYYRKAKVENFEHFNYFIHEYLAGRALELSMKKLGKPNCIYWPHYSLRVGVTKTCVLKDVGEYNETASHFEMEYAYRYVTKKYLTTYLDNIYCEHIGRKTYERNIETKINAYDLNNECQFGKLPKGQSQVQAQEQSQKQTQTQEAQYKESERNIKKWLIEPSKSEESGEEIRLDHFSKLTNKLGKRGGNEGESKQRDITVGEREGEREESRKREAREAREVRESNQDNIIKSLESSINRDLNLKTFLINLKRREDRLNLFKEKNRGNIPPYHILEAVDGMTLVPSHKIQNLFKYNDYNYRRGIVGCALSHLSIYFHILGSGIDGALILEDDAELCPYFTQKFLHVLEKCPDADVIFLGHHPYKQYAKGEYYDKEKIPSVELWTKERCIRESMGGTTGYYITREGARKLISNFNKNSIRYGIDWEIFHSADINKIYYTTPFLAFAECAPNAHVDSDIQYDFNGVGYQSLETWLSEEIESLHRIISPSGDYGKDPVFSTSYTDVKTSGDKESKENRENSSIEDTQYIYLANKKYRIDNDNVKGKKSKSLFYYYCGASDSLDKEIILPDKSILLNKIVLIDCRKTGITKSHFKLYPVKSFYVGMNNEYLITIPENKCTEELQKQKCIEGYIVPFIKDFY